MTSASRTALPAWAGRLLAAGPWLLVTAFSLWLLWPSPRGSMPLSADHTVHLSRIWMFAQQLAQGQVRGWDSAWFFGTPVGELYPVLGDLVIVGLRALSFGALSWPQAYALGFALVFTVQGWALLRVGRTMGLGVVPGLVAALLVLADVGAYREGGWMYTVVYGVWPQALATALTWLAMGELCVACETDDPAVRRTRLATAGLSMGGALLAHPMAITSFLVGGPLVVIVFGLRSHADLRRTVGVSLLAAALGIAVSVWWLLPMLQHRAWMASYGWLWMPLDRMAAMAAEGHWTQAMPTAVGACAGLGLAMLALGGNRSARVLGTFALVSWLLASEDTLWGLRLDQLSEGFTHIQYQRFLITAKPGLMLAAGAAVAVPLRGAVLAWRMGNQRLGRPLAAGLAAAALGLGAWMAVQQRDLSREHHVGTLPVERIPGEADFDREYAQLVEWMQAQPADDGPPYRYTVVASRNVHWFMDATALAGIRLFKQGFTPGDNFVHKPEAGSTEILDRARVRYVISTGGRGSRRMQEVASFGTIRVSERPGWAQQPIAWLRGPGQLEVLEEDVDGGLVRVRISGAGEGTRVTFGVAGFPRWTLERDGQPVEWLEVPVAGEGPEVTADQRRQGWLRGGKAHGDDGTEPTLIAADVGDGELVLRYHPRRTSDVLAGVVSIVALLGGVLLVWRPRRFTAPTVGVERVIAALSRLGHPAVVGVAALLLVAVLAVRRADAEDVERRQAYGWLEDGLAEAGRHARAGLLKTEMLIQPAVLVDARRSGPAGVVFHDVTIAEALRGWVAIDDDAAKQRRNGRHRLRIEVSSDGGAPTTLLETWVPHRPGRLPLSMETGALAGQRMDVRVVVESEGKSPPPLGFDLDLGAPP